MNHGLSVLIKCTLTDRSGLYSDDFLMLVRGAREVEFRQAS